MKKEDISIGLRVQTNSEHAKVFPKAKPKRRGVITALTTRGWIDCVRVRWDGRAHAETISTKFLEPEA